MGVGVGVGVGLAHAITTLTIVIRTRTRRMLFFLIHLLLRDYWEKGWEEGFSEYFLLNAHHLLLSRFLEYYSCNNHIAVTYYHMPMIAYDDYNTFVNTIGMEK